MFPPRVRFLMVIVETIFLFATGCVPNFTNEVDVPVTTTIGSTPANGIPLVRIEWTYRDAQRLAVELSVSHYPLPSGFQTICPLTQLVIKDGLNENLLLYRNPEQISLDEFYVITRHSHWYCKKQTENNGFADYLFSLTYDYGTETGFQWSKKASLSVDLGEVVATNSSSVTTLPSQGIFDFPLEFEIESKNLTWSDSAILTDNGVRVEINRVAVNPSFALLDACINYQDHHFWRPIAAILYGGQEAHSTEFIPTFPGYPFDRDSILESTRRCYALIIPFDFPLDSLSAFQIGIKQVEVMNTDAGVVTLQECEAAKEQLEKTYSGLHIRCYEFEMRGQQQHWFEVLSRPPDISTQEAYEIAESAFTQTISGPWYVEIP